MNTILKINNCAHSIIYRTSWTIPKRKEKTTCENKKWIDHITSKLWNIRLEHSRWPFLLSYFPFLFPILSKSITFIIIIITFYTILTECIQFYILQFGLVWLCYCDMLFFHTPYGMAIHLKLVWYLWEKSKLCRYRKAIISHFAHGRNLAGRTDTKVHVNK